MDLLFITLIILVNFKPLWAHSTGDWLPFSENPSSFCDLEIEKKIQFKSGIIKEKYKSIDSKYGILKAKNASLFLSGKNGKAVMLQHGFIASPFEVLKLATHLNDLGYTVYAPLLFGFGSSGAVANSVSYKIWVKDFEENMGILKQCYSKVNLIGFSLGASLSLYYSLNHPEDVASIVLLSPFYEFSQTFLTKIAQLATVFTSQISIRNLYSLSGVPDLKPIIKYPLYYNSTFPLYASQEVVELGKVIQIQYSQIKKRSSDPLNIPNLTIVSQSDKTINLSYAIQFPKVLFKQSQQKVYDSSLHIPHQITLPDFNSKFDDLTNKISFILGSI